MKKGTIGTSILVAAAVTLVVMCAFSVRITPATDMIAILGTTGITCGGCGAAVERALYRKSGVAAVEIDVEHGRVAVGYDSKRTGAEMLAATVIGAGYGCRVAEVLTPERYRAITGKAIGRDHARCCGADTSR